MCRAGYRGTNIFSASRATWTRGLSPRVSFSFRCRLVSKRGTGTGRKRRGVTKMEMFDFPVSSTQRPGSTPSPRRHHAPALKPSQSLVAEDTFWRSFSTTDKQSAGMTRSTWLRGRVSLFSEMPRTRQAASETTPVTDYNACSGSESEGDVSRK
jgi:hypothetical protein